jgi:hypothetical protein
MMSSHGSTGNLADGHYRKNADFGTHLRFFLQVAA